jgi:hypothetical protein
MISRATITSMTWMILRTIPPIALSASRAPEGDAGRLGRRASPPAQRSGAVAPGFQIHLKFAFCSNGGISVF